MTEDAYDDEEEDPDIHYFSRFFAVCMGVLYTMFFAQFAWHLSRGRDDDAYLFKVHTRMSRVEGWAKMRIANAQVMYPYRPIQSISEFSAIAGGQANHMLSYLGPITWAALMMMYAAHMQYIDGKYEWDIAEYTMVIGVNGLVGIGFFELNEFYHGLVFGHYVSVTMSCLIQVGGLVHGWSLSQPDSSAPRGYRNLIFPACMCACAIPCLLGWQWTARDSNCLRFEQQVKDVETLRGHKSEKSEAADMEKKVD